MTVSREQAYVCYQFERSLLSDSSLLALPPPPFFFLLFSPSLRRWKVRSPWQMLGPLNSFVARRRWSTWSSFRQRDGFFSLSLSRKQLACPLYRREENKRYRYNDTLFAFEISDIFASCILLWPRMILHSFLYFWIFTYYFSLRHCAISYKRKWVTIQSFLQKCIYNPPRILNLPVKILYRRNIDSRKNKSRERDGMGYNRKEKLVELGQVCFRFVSILRASARVENPWSKNLFPFPRNGRERWRDGLREFQRENEAWNRSVSRPRGAKAPYQPIVLLCPPLENASAATHAHTCTRGRGEPPRFIAFLFFVGGEKRRKNPWLLFKQTYSPDDERGFLKINRCGWARWCSWGHLGKMSLLD